jgi:hypothetical protein
MAKHGKAWQSMAKQGQPAAQYQQHHPDRDIQMQHSGGNNQEKQAKLRHQNQQKHGPSTPNNVLWQARWLWAATGTAHVLLQDCNNPRAAHSNSTVPQITHYIM